MHHLWFHFAGCTKKRMHAHTHMYPNACTRIHTCFCSCPPMATHVGWKLTLSPRLHVVSACGSYYDPTLSAQVLAQVTQPQGGKPYRTIYLVATSIAPIGIPFVVIYFRMGTFRLRYFVASARDDSSPRTLNWNWSGSLCLGYVRSVGAKCSRYCAGHISVTQES